jgi:hypothetical protein
VIDSRPVVTAMLGTSYRYQVSATSSLGDLSSQMQENDQVSGYFDIEQPRFTLQRGPSWLKLDEATGVPSGIPDTSGKVKVAGTVALDRDSRRLEEKSLVFAREVLPSRSQATCQVLHCGVLVTFTTHYRGFVGDRGPGLFADSAGRPC